MKKVFFILGTLLLSLSTYAAMNVNKIDPPFWYTGMQNPELQLMVYGEGIGNATVSVNYPGVSLSSTVKLESNNYLLVYLRLDKNVKPGKMPLTFTQGKKKFVKEYELKERAKKGCEHKGFDASDALYLLMPDRFANGNPDNDQIAGMAEYKVDRNDPNARHGGDLAGIEQHLDYFSDLGVTALWFTPVLENNMTGGSYHGYATTDYYKVDPRFGTNEEYKQLIEKTHTRGIKIVMDMIFNHCGSENYLYKDMPSKDWFNFKGNYVTKDDVKIAKNYLSEIELQRLNLLVSGFLDFAEFQALEMNPMTMKDWIEALDNQIIAHKRKVLIDKGRISHKQAIEKAEKEFAIYRKREMDLLESDFDKEIKRLKDKNDNNPN